MAMRICPMAVETRIRSGVVANACPSMMTVRCVTPSPAMLSLRPRRWSVMPPPPLLNSAHPMVVGTLSIGSLGEGVGGTVMRSGGSKIIA